MTKKLKDLAPEEVRELRASLAPDAPKSFNLADYAISMKEIDICEHIKGIKSGEDY